MLIVPAVILFARCQTGERTAKVSFLVVDQRGNALAGWRVTAFKSTSIDVASQFVGLAGSRIPTGFYQYTLTGPTVSRGSIAPAWIQTLGGRVEVLRPEEFVVATATDDVLSGMSIDRAAPPFSFAIAGKIEPVPPQTRSSDPVRINLHSPIPPWSDIDVRVDSNGEFRIHHALVGLWVLTVMRGEEVLHVEPVLFRAQPQSTSFVLRIGDKPRSVLRVQ